MDTDARWDESMPAVYDRILGPALFAPFAEHLAATAQSLTPLRVLEIAAGTGIVTAALLRALPDTQITATDLNPAMVSWGAEHAGGAAWSVADAQALDFPDGSFDLVVCQFGAMFFPDRAAAYAEAARVLGHGAPLLLAIWDVVEASPFPTAVVGALSAVLPDDSPDFLARVPHGYTDPDRIEADLRAGGFTQVDIERVVLRGTSPSARLLAEGFCLGTPLRFSLEQRALEQRALEQHGSLDHLTEAIADEMERRLGAGPVVGDLAAFVVTAAVAVA